MTARQYEKIIELLLKELNNKETEIFLLKLKIEELQKGESDDGEL